MAWNLKFSNITAISLGILLLASLLIVLSDLVNFNSCLFTGFILHPIKIRLVKILVRTQYLLLSLLFFFFLVGAIISN